MRGYRENEEEESNVLKGYKNYPKIKNSKNFLFERPMFHLPGIPYAEKESACVK